VCTRSCWCCRVRPAVTPNKISVANSIDHHPRHPKRFLRFHEEALSSSSFINRPFANRIGPLQIDEHPQPLREPAAESRQAQVVRTRPINFDSIARSLELLNSYHSRETPEFLQLLSICFPSSRETLCSACSISCDLLRP
jgi:hypothetical protein